MQLSPQLTNWGDLVKAIRGEQRVPQRKLAKELGINRSMLRRLEAGKAYDIRLIEAVFWYLGYDLDAMLVEQEPVAEIVMTLPPDT